MNKVLPKSKPRQEDQTEKKLPKTSISKGNVTFSFAMFICKSIKNRQFNNHFTNMWEYGEWSLKLLYRISKYCADTPAKLKCGGESTRCHVVKGKRLNKLKSVLKDVGFSGSTLDEQISEDGYYELTLSCSDGRIFGFFTDNIFYILLFDPHHLIYENYTHGSYQDLLYRNYDPWNVINSVVD